MDSKIKNYISQYSLYGIAIQPKKRGEHSIIALSSMETSNNNQIEIISDTLTNNVFPRQSGSDFNLISSIQVKYPITRLEFSPANKNLLAASSDCLRLYSIEDLNIKEILSFPHNAPLSSLNFSKVNPDIIGITSVDTSVSLYNVKENKKINSFKGSNKECYDISFSPNEETFIVCGGDGNIRLFDLRTNDSSIIFDTNSKEIIMKNSVNKLNDNFYSFLTLNGANGYVVDRRNYNTIYKKLSYHKSSINNCTWSPKSNCQLFSVSDDKNAVFWDIQFINGQEARMYQEESFAIENCEWMDFDSEDWVGIVGEKTFRLLRVR